MTPIVKVVTPLPLSHSTTIIQCQCGCTVCSCLWYFATPFLSIALHIKYIYITLHFTTTFSFCSVFFLFYIFCRWWGWLVVVGQSFESQRGHHYEEGGTCGSVGCSRGPDDVCLCLALFIDSSCMFHVISQSILYHYSLSAWLSLLRASLTASITLHHIGNWC